jgi:hypothetical protein
MPALNPFTGHYLVHYTRPTAAEENRRMLAELLERIATGCAAADTALIGHIKAFAAQPGGGYLTASVTSARVPAQVEAGGHQPQDRLEVCLTVLAYGLERERLEQIVAEAWQDLAGEGLMLSVRRLPATQFSQAPEERFT